MRQLSHNASICNRNVHTCAHFYYKMLHCGIWDWCIMGFNRPIVPSGIHCNKILFRLHTFSFKKVCLKMLTARYRPFWSIVNLLMRISGKTGPWFNIKMSSCQYRKSHCGDKTVIRSSYLHNGIFYTGKMSLYWIGPLVSDVATTQKFAWLVIGKLCIALIRGFVEYKYCSVHKVREFHLPHAAHRKRWTFLQVFSCVSWLTHCGPLMPYGDWNRSHY